MRKARVPDWVEEQRRRYFRFAGHTARREDGRWNTKLLDWTPFGARLPWRPTRRWGDSITKFFIEVEKKGGDWITEAFDRSKWGKLEEVFVKFAG